MRSTLRSRLGTGRRHRSKAADDVVKMIARTLFVSAWADREEARGRRWPPRRNLFDVAPRTPQAARQAAEILVAKMEVHNEVDFDRLYDQAVVAAGGNDSPRLREEFGYYVAMEALGSGVAWTDNYPNHGIDIPDFEFRL